jgi:hypothetical protein
VTIGVLALQGDFARHGAALARCGVSSVEVRKPAELDDVDGLIVPGGESTTLLTLLRAWDFGPAIEAFHAAGRPLFGTCAGLILLAREVEHPRQPSLGLIDLRVERNAYGRQRESFETMASMDLGHGPRPPARSSSGPQDPSGGAPGFGSWGTTPAIPCWSARLPCWLQASIPSSPTTSPCTSTSAPWRRDRRRIRPSWAQRRRQNIGVGMSPQRTCAGGISTPVTAGAEMSTRATTIGSRP